VLISELSDAELMRRCAEGDDRAWREIVDRHAALVFSIAKRAGLDRDEREDAFQTVMTILVREVPRFRDGQSLVKWLITTTQRESWRRARRANRTPTPIAGETSTNSHDPERLEREHAVRLAFARLGERCQSLLRALVTEPGAPSYEQVANRLGMPIGSLGPTRARCLDRLREILLLSEGWTMFGPPTGPAKKDP
jgi:RNA polymerase sigma factor (sigma-70 family)